METPGTIINNIAPSTPAWQPWLADLGSLLIAGVTLVGIRKSNRTNRLAIASADARDKEQWRRDRVVQFTVELAATMDALITLCREGQYDPRRFSDSEPPAEQIRYIMWDFFKVVENRQIEMDRTVANLGLVAGEVALEVLKRAAALPHEFVARCQTMFILQDKHETLERTQFNKAEENQLFTEWERSRDNTDEVVARMKDTYGEIFAVVRRDIGVDALRNAD